MDWVVIDDALWARLLTFFPAALRVEWWVPGQGLRRSDIPICTLCKRKKTPKQVATPATPASPASPADAPVAPHRLTLPTAPKRRAVTAVVSSAASTTTNTTTATPTTASAAPNKEDADSTGEYQPEDDWEAPHRAGCPKKEAAHVVIRITLQQLSTLCAAILDGSFTPASLFDDSLSPAQHRETVLQTPCLQSLLARSLP